MGSSRCHPDLILDPRPPLTFALLQCALFGAGAALALHLISLAVSLTNVLRMARCRRRDAAGFIAVRRVPS